MEPHGAKRCLGPSFPCTPSSTIHSGMKKEDKSAQHLLCFFHHQLPMVLLLHCQPYGFVRIRVFLYHLGTSSGPMSTQVKLDCPQEHLFWPWLLADGLCIYQLWSNSDLEHIFPWLSVIWQQLLSSHSHISRYAEHLCFWVDVCGYVG